MNGGPKPIRAIEITKHTGVVWTATFPYPGEEFFLDSFQWRVYDDMTGRNIDFQAVGLHKLGSKKSRSSSSDFTTAPYLRCRKAAGSRSIFYRRYREVGE